MGDKLRDELLATADVGDSKKKRVPRPQTRAHTRARSSPVSAPCHLTPKSAPRRVVKSKDNKVVVEIRSRQRAPSNEQRLIKSPDGQNKRVTTRDGGRGKRGPLKSRDGRGGGQRSASPIIEYPVMRVTPRAKTRGGGKRAPAKTRDDRGQRPASRAKTRGGGGGKRGAPAKSPTTSAGKGASRDKPRTY